MNSPGSSGKEQITAGDVADFIESLAVKPGGDEGFKFGDPTAVLTGVLVCWMNTLGGY